ncbi:MAG: RraA family protein [Thermoguttaceae bacterium]|jgi:regulator of RNase E activity RraA|nr:RraA family protein [Thermoguttaceae bacterium]
MNDHRFETTAETTMIHPAHGSGCPISTGQMRQRYMNLFTGAVNDVLRFKYKMHASALPSDYLPLRDDMVLAGQAFTIKGGPDITTDGEFEMRAEMLEALHEDSIVVWDCTGDRVTAQWGEVMTMAAILAGCRGAVVNGIRDTNGILRQGFPVFHKYRCSTGMLGRFRMYHYQRPILMGELVVQPGDWIFGDIDGVLAIPQAIAYDVLVAAEQILNKEVEIKDWVENGVRPTEVVARGGYF